MTVSDAAVDILTSVHIPSYSNILANMATPNPNLCSTALQVAGSKWRAHRVRALWLWGRPGCELLVLVCHYHDLVWNNRPLHTDPLCELDVK